MSDWIGMESAPRDYVDVLISVKTYDDAVIGYFDEPKGKWIVPSFGPGYSNINEIDVDGWMPIPQTLWKAKASYASVSVEDRG